MKILINKCIVLFILVFFVTTFLVYGYSLYLRNKISFKINLSKNVLVLGDSYTECAIDDSILVNYANYSQSGQPYIHTYVLCNRFLTENPQINTVLLSFHYGSLSKSIDKCETDMLYKYLPFLTIEDFKNLIKEPSLLYNGIINFQYDRFFNWINKDRSIKGGYINLVRNNLENIKKNEIKKSKKETDKESKIQIVFLEKIINLCMKRKVKLFFLSTPVYQSNNKVFSDYYLKHYSNIALLDYSDFKLPVEFYGDSSHLNFQGSKYFSEYLLRNGLVDIKADIDR